MESKNKKFHPVKCLMAISPKAKLFNRVKFPSELRMDLVSRDWVVIATGRARRPETFKQEKRIGEKASKKDCPFCEIDKQEKPTLIFNNSKELPISEGIPRDWTLIVVPNKYPAFLPFDELEPKTEGQLYQKMNAVGFHEVVVFIDHEKSIAQLSVIQTKEIFEAYQQRYLSLMPKKFVNHIAIFHNHGKEAGASIAHPHSQIITTPLIDTDLKKALRNAKEYFKKNKKCIYCEMSQLEQKEKKRVVFENREFLVVCPFASKASFQMIISPKKHLANFENITAEQISYLAEAFQAAMKKLYKGLGDPAYNFYLHTAPSNGENHDYYHWHWTILPKTSTWAGFELGARMEISTIEPEKAAAYLRKQ